MAGGCAGESSVSRASLPLLHFPCVWRWRWRFSSLLPRAGLQRTSAPCPVPLSPALARILRGERASCKTNADASPPQTADLRLSHDAGRYLCEYIYYASLAHLWRRGEERRVLFLHVPAAAGAEAVRRGVEVVEGLVAAVVGALGDKGEGRGRGGEEVEVEEGGEMGLGG